MKTLIKSLAVALSLGFVMSVSSVSEAKPTKPIGRPTGIATYKSGIYTTTSGSLSIALDKETGGAVDIRLKTADGTVVYSQHVGKKDRTFRTRLNLSELPDGDYQVEITNGVETTTQAVTISTQQPATPSRLISVE